MLSFWSMQAVNKCFKCPLLSPRSCLKVSGAFLSSKEIRDPDYKKPTPFPYETKKYTYFHMYFDHTSKRFDDNSKLIIVDGNICAGKTTFAKQLAEAFDMKYVPEPDLEDLYITSYGYDLRKLDPLLPWAYKSCDLAKFYEDPHARNVTLFQFRMYMKRYAQYIDALAHILNTGQGVVLDRCVYSDRVFLEAMHTCGYVKKNARDFYTYMYNNCMEELMTPHLIIYLDVSSETALERIKKRNDPIEVNSKVLNKQYLDCIEYEYKQNYLPKMETKSELIVYDWNHFGDVEVVIEDLERINLDRFSKYEAKMLDWRKEEEWEWNLTRYRYSSQKLKLLRYAYFYRPDIPELCPSTDDVVDYKTVMLRVPGERYNPGFNPDLGDKVLFKWGPKNYRDHPICRYV